jgi:hypothetical protein
MFWLVSSSGMKKVFPQFQSAGLWRAFGRTEKPYANRLLRLGSQRRERPLSSVKVPDICFHIFGFAGTSERILTAALTDSTHLSLFMRQSMRKATDGRPSRSQGRECRPCTLIFTHGRCPFSSRTGIMPRHKLAVPEAVSPATDRHFSPELAMFLFYLCPVANTM